LLSQKNKFVYAVIILFILGLIITIFSLNKNMKLSSKVFENGKIPLRYTCDGENINPLLEISQIPENAKTLALIVDDPDAPTKVWVHWVVWNISTKMNVIAENSVPLGAIQGINDMGKEGYNGPCPPSGTHRYFFKLYALDDFLDLPAGSTKEKVEKAMQDHIVDKTELIGSYSKS
jgi:Raf kinase inhibitor-like YbhB/YbcL family protein